MDGKPWRAKLGVRSLHKHVAMTTLVSLRFVLCHLNPIASSNFAPGWLPPSVSHPTTTHPALLPATHPWTVANTPRTLAARSQICCYLLGLVAFDPKFAIIYSIRRPPGQSATLPATLRVLKSCTYSFPLKTEGLHIGLRSGRGGAKCCK